MDKIKKLLQGKEFSNLEREMLDYFMGLTDGVNHSRAETVKKFFNIDCGCEICDPKRENSVYTWARQRLDNACIKAMLKSSLKND